MSLRSLVSQLIINVIFENNNGVVLAQVFKGGKVVKSYEKSFENRKKLLNYVESLTRNYQIYYIALFLDDVTQGLVPGNEISHLSKFGVDAKSVITLPLPNAQIYAPKALINQSVKSFANFGELDLIFSPFMLLYLCINSKTKIKKDKITLYIYRHSNYLALMICENKKILFGKFFDISLQNKDEESVEELNEEIEELNFDEDPNLEALNTPQNETIKMKRTSGAQLDDDITADLDESMENTPLNDGDINAAADLSTFGDDMDMCGCIFGAVAEFYNDPLYAGRFVEEMVAFCTADLSSAVIDYIQGEIFITPQIIKINSFELMGELAKKELNL